MGHDAPLILVDGSSYLYRAFHALPPLTNEQGEPTGAMYGVINMLRKLIIDYRPSHFAVVFDAKGKTFRDDLYAEYKAHRPPMPTELIQQIEPLHKIIQAMGLPLLMVEGVEADDVIGTLARQAADNGMAVLISTGDKDMAQLVNDKITLINTMNNTVLDVAGVMAKFGVPPELMIDYLAIVGDSSDNIPGIPKAGPKTAVKWLEEFQSLENLVANAEKISGKVGENLRENLQTLSLARQLVTIKCDVELPCKLNDLTIAAAERAQLIELYKRYEFKTWLSEVLDNEPAAPSQKSHYRAIFKEEEFKELMAELMQAEIFAFDTETTSLNYMEAEIVGLSFALKPHEAVYIPVGHIYSGDTLQLNPQKVLTALKPLLENPAIKKLGHNVKYDQEVLANYDIKLQGVAYDTMLESYLLDSTANRHDLDTLALKFLGHKNISYQEVAGKGAKQIGFEQVAIDIATNYAAEDADIALRLHQHLWPKVTENEKLVEIFNRIELPLLHVLVNIERNGVLVNIEALQQLSIELAKRLHELEQQIFAMAGVVFNIESPKQLQEVLFTRLKLPIIEKTPTGQASTSESVLQELALNYPLPKLILEYRSLGKLKSTYSDKLPEKVNVKTGRVHTSYHQASVATGRLSSSDPNLQNIPIRTAEGRRIRQAFIAPAGYKIIAADYSQIELRIMAHLSGSRELIDAFNNNIDVHKATASQIFGVKLEAVTSEQRRKAKAINFGLIYGMSAFGLAKQIGVERAIAQAYMDAYFVQYPGVRAYMERARKTAHTTGYVETLYGRRLYLPEINSRNLQRQRAAERAAINAPMQGTAADIIKRAMVAVDEWLTEQQVKGRMIMQVHDELVFEIAEKEVEMASHYIPQLMSQAADLVVPLVVDVGVGNNWDEAH